MIVAIASAVVLIILCVYMKCCTCRREEKEVEDGRKTNVCCWCSTSESDGDKTEEQPVASPRAKACKFVTYAGIYIVSVSLLTLSYISKYSYIRR